MSKHKKPSKGVPNVLARKKHNPNECKATMSYRTSGGWRRCIACHGVV